jgi:predicted Rossmann fold flavoprotein
LIAIVGAGAAGLATAIFAARRGASGPIVAFDGAARLGAKILVSGGARCNVTNRVVTDQDFAGGNPNVVRGILRAFPAGEAVSFFREIGVALHEEPGGKLFPDSNRARTVLDALLAEASRRGVELRAGQRVHRVVRDEQGFRLATSRGEVEATRVVLATGGLSLPKTGSDGVGYGMAVALGHRLVPRTPALVPLVLEGDFHAALAGVSHEAELVVRGERDRPVVRRGSLLWTHFGVSGPVVLDVSRFWHRALEEGRDARVSASLLPGRSFGEIEGALLAQAAANPQGQVKGALAAWLPAAVAAAVPGRLGVAADTRLGQLTREERRRVIRGLLDWPLPVKGSRGYDYAEVTAGGVPLAEIEPRTMASRRCPGLYLVGEILDVDGRIGGFNFQWAWSTAWVAAGALARVSTGTARDEAGVVVSRPWEG